MNIKKIKKGDLVKIMVGKDAGKQGNVARLLPDAGKIIVEGANLYKKHLKGDGRQKESAIVTIAKPLSVSNVMLVCPSCGKPTRVGIEVKDGKKVRVCKKCGKTIEKKAAVAKSEKTEKKATVSKKKTTKNTTKKTTTKKVTTKKTTKK